MLALTTACALSGWTLTAGVAASKAGSSRASVVLQSQDELKKQVGYKAVDDYVKSGMVVGLGTGSTAAFAVERVGMLLKSGELKDIVAVPTSERTREQAEELGIPLTTLGTPESRFSDLDVAIDGADEVDPALNLVKGGGGALLREKMVEVCAKKFIVIVDESKLCDGLGPGFPLPVEITPFCWEHTMRTVAGLPSLEGCEAKLRMGSAATGSKVDGDEPAVTDNGNYIVDLFVRDRPRTPLLLHHHHLLLLLCSCSVSAPLRAAAVHPTTCSLTPNACRCVACAAVHDAHQGRTQGG